VLLAGPRYRTTRWELQTDRRVDGEGAPPARRSRRTMQVFDGANSRPPSFPHRCSRLDAGDPPAGSCSRLSGCGRAGLGRWCFGPWAGLCRSATIGDGGRDQPRSQTGAPTLGRPMTARVRRVRHRLYRLFRVRCELRSERPRGSLAFAPASPTLASRAAAGASELPGGHSTLSRLLAGRRVRTLARLRSLAARPPSRAGRPRGAGVVARRPSLSGSCPDPTMVRTTRARIVPALALGSSTSDRSTAIEMIQPEAHGPPSSGSHRLSCSVPTVRCGGTRVVNPTVGHSPSPFF